MEAFIAWCGFAGAWLLVAGPVLQAALELEEEAAARESVRSVMEATPPPKPVSAWWWLLPPVHFVLQKRRSDAFQQHVMSRLTLAQREGLLSYLDKARAWGYVAAGGTLLATKETWEVREHYEWPALVFWLLIVVMLALCFGNTSISAQRRARELGQDGHGRPQPAPGA